MKKWISNLMIGLVFLFLYMPIIVLIIFSFNNTKLNILFEGFTLEWYKVIPTNIELLIALKNTLIVAITSTLISTIIGTISAIGLHKFNFKGKNLINEILYIPIVMPDIVIGISLLSIYTLMNFSLGMMTLIVAHIAFSIPYVIVSVRSSLQSMNKELEEVSSDLGANSIQTFFKVTLPSIAPGIYSGLLMAFTLSMDDVVISYFTSGPDSNTLPLYIYSMIKSGVTPDVNAMFTIIIVIALIVLTIYSLKTFKKRVRVWKK